MVAFVPFRQSIFNYAPGWLSFGTGERWLYWFGLSLDIVAEKRFAATLAHFPLRGVGGYLAGGPAPSDAGSADMLAQIGADKLILRGYAEGDLSYGYRLQGALDTWALAGTARGVLSNALGYLLPMTPEVLAVSSTYDPSTYPSALASSQWDVYPVGRPYNVEPVHYDVETIPVGHFVVPGGNFDWDSLSPVNGSYSWWGALLIFYAVAPNDFVHPAHLWGAAGTFTTSAPRYSTSVLGQRIAAGTFVGGEGWGQTGTFTTSAPRYSQSVNGARVPAGQFSGGRAWGIVESTDFGRSIQLVIGPQFKGANTWVRGIVVSFSLARFDPSQPAGGGINPDGTFGRWSKSVSGQRVGSRFTDCVYGGSII